MSLDDNNLIIIWRKLLQIGLHCMWRTSYEKKHNGFDAYWTKM